MLRACSLLVAVGVVSAGVTECGNGNTCLEEHTCVTHKPQAGRKFHCAPLPEAVICADSRYSCPNTFTCHPGTAKTCSKPGIFGKDGKAVHVPMSRNVLAKRSVLLARRAPPVGGLCDIISGNLPAICNCTDAHLGGEVLCEVNVLDKDTIGVAVNILPCAKPASISFNVTEADKGISYSVGESLPYTGSIPVPGLSIVTPIGSGGVELEVTLDGDVDQMQVDVAVDVCVDVPVWGKECGSKITSDLPYVLLNQTFDFSKVCAAN